MSGSDNNSEKPIVIQNVSDNVINFNSKDEFLTYYHNNREEVNSIKTRGLNLKYKINGFKIGRQKGKIVLIPLKESPQPESKPESDLNSEIMLLLESIGEGIKKINENVDILLDQRFNALKPEMKQPSQFRSLNGYGEYLNKSLGNL